DQCCAAQVAASLDVKIVPFSPTTTNVPPPNVAAFKFSVVPETAASAFMFTPVTRLGERHSFKKLFVCRWLSVAGCEWFVFRRQLLRVFSAFCAFLRPISSFQRTALESDRVPPACPTSLRHLGERREGHSNRDRSRCFA